MVEKKVAIITGASSGMGEALSRDLAAKGWHVAMADLKKNDLLSQELGNNASFHQTDVADYDSQARTFDEVFSRFGRIDALLANAGILDRDSLYILKYRDSATFPPRPNLICTDVDYKGVVYGTQLAVHFMRKNDPPGGSICATASIAALHPHETFPEYDGAKAAVVNFVRAMAPVLRVKENIRINAVLPGIVATKLITEDVIAAVSPDCITPVATVVSAYNEVLEDEELTGQAIECSVDKTLRVPWTKALNGRATERAATVWEPMFIAFHGESSELPDAIM